MTKIVILKSDSYVKIHFLGILYL